MSRIDGAIESQEYHTAHLALARSTIATKAFRGERILDLLVAYTDDVVKSERDRVEGKLREIVELEDAEDSCGYMPDYYLAAGLAADLARAAMGATSGT